MMHPYYVRTSLGFVLLVFLFNIIGRFSIEHQVRRVPVFHGTSEALARCHQLSLRPGPPEHFHERTSSDRFETGTPPVLIQNAKLWTGRKNGTEVIKGDILLDKGLIQSIGHLPRSSLQNYAKNLVIVDAKNAWVTPGIVDAHSHIGVSSSPELEGASDTNSFHGIVQPWLRSLDGLNTHDDAYPLSIAGGVTTSLILPGSSNAIGELCFMKWYIVSLTVIFVIGGQAFVIKLRETLEKSSSSMVLEPPYQINTSFPNPNLPPRWRHIKYMTF